jgi:hypothetical protein
MCPANISGTQPWHRICPVMGPNPWVKVDGPNMSGPGTGYVRKYLLQPGDLAG